MVHDHNYLMQDERILENSRRTLWVCLLTAVMMIVEIVYGYVTGSMALLADGWHMASHAAALGISYGAYWLARSERLTNKFSFGTGKLIPLGGYSSALVLAMVAVLMIVESVQRFLNPGKIHYDEALLVAVIGLIVNVVSVFLLRDNHDHHHHDHGHDHDDDHHHSHDHNMRGAYLHVLADALTSVLAIVALFLGRQYQIVWLDALIGCLGAVVILKWAFDLCRATGFELLDGHALSHEIKHIERRLTELGAVVLDLHIWRIAPNAHASELIIGTKILRGGQFYRDALSSIEEIKHLVVEEVLI